MPIDLGPGEAKQLDVALTPITVPPPDPATLDGIVTDAETGHGIEGVRVDMSGDGWIGFTYTGADGSYLIDNIPPGTYTVIFSHPDYETKTI